MHFFHLRLFMQTLVVLWICAWLGMWGGTLYLCAYGNRLQSESKQTQVKESERIPFDIWMIYIHFGLILLLPGSVALMFISYLLEQTGVISGVDGNVLNGLTYEFSGASLLISLAPYIIRAVCLLFSREEKDKVPAEIINPFTGHLNADETILWLGNPVQPYFGKKKSKPVGYLMGIYSIVVVFLAIQTTHIWRVHNFYHVVKFTTMLALPFMLYVVFRMMKSDYDRNEHYYAVTNKRLLNANRVSSNYFTRCSLRYEYIDFSKTTRLPEAKGIDTLNYTSKIGGWSYMFNNQCMPGVNTDICFRCIEDAETVEALVCVAYEESQNSNSFNAV